MPADLSAGRVFVDNASFGVYAEVVQSPAYRDDKAGTILEMLPDLLTHPSGTRLSVRAGSLTMDGPQAVLVSNNPYERGDSAGMGRGSELDPASWGCWRECRHAAEAAERVVRAGGRRAVRGRPRRCVDLPFPVRPWGEVGGR